MASRDWQSIPSSELLLTSSGTGLMAWWSPRVDLLAVVAIVLLARFLGRATSVVAASAFSLAEVARILANHVDLLQAMVALSAVWLCAIFAPGANLSSGPTPKGGSLFDVSLDKLSKYVWSRAADGTLEYVSPACCEYLGVSLDQMQDVAHFTHPEDIEVSQNAMTKADLTREPQQFRARYRSATGEYQWFATLLHTQRDSHNSVIRYFGLQWNIDEDKRKEEQMSARDNIWESSGTGLAAVSVLQRPMDC